MSRSRNAFYGVLLGGFAGAYAGVILLGNEVPLPGKVEAAAEYLPGDTSYENIYPQITAIPGVIIGFAIGVTRTPNRPRQRTGGSSDGGNSSGWFDLGGGGDDGDGGDGD